MSIPDFQSLFRPVLELAAKQGGEISRSVATEAMSVRFNLTEDERQQRSRSSGGTYIYNRSGWALTYLTKAGLLERKARNSYSITELGQQFLQLHPQQIRNKDLRSLPAFRDFQSYKRDDDVETTADGIEHGDDATKTPYERIDSALVEINAHLSAQVLQELLAKPPDFFERVVLDVLSAMGYGGNRLEAAEHIGGVGDEGLDGRINQDALGLDVVVVQAKRYKADNIVGREPIQQFIGAMHGHGVTKGIFITTSSFAKTAVEFVSRSGGLKVVLIDGQRLASLMLQHKIGVRVERHADVLALDNNYFSEDE